MSRLLRIVSTVRTALAIAGAFSSSLFDPHATNRISAGDSSIILNTAFRQRTFNFSTPIINTMNLLERIVLLAAFRYIIEI
jgi:hypothetical protein